MLAPILHPASGTWLLGKIENHTARPLTKAEVEGVIAREEALRLLSADNEEQLKQAREGREAAQRQLEWIRQNCRVVFYPPGFPTAYPIEHAPAALKDQWDELMAQVPMAADERG